MPDIKNNAWKRTGASIKLIVESIKLGRSDRDIITMVKEFRGERYSEEMRLVESDLFLLYCKLIENNRKDIVKELCLIEDLVEFEEEYIYEAAYKENGENLSIWLSLIDFCMLHEVDWKDIAYIQQHRKIENATKLRIKLEKFTSSGQHKVSNESFSSHNPTVFEKYAPYLWMGESYVGFINKKDVWDVKLIETYKEYPWQVNEYLEYMAQHFTLAIRDSSEESKIEDISKSKKDWLETYAKALRSMTEVVITLIKNKRSLTQGDKRQSLYETSLQIYSHLFTCEKELHILDKKPRNKLMEFIQSLKTNIDKVSPIQAETNTQFFRPAGTSLNAFVEEAADKSSLNAAPPARRSSI
ncbi:MAG: hypothetical protein V4471_03245 [Pseudomonadota bacterium]